MMDEKHNVGQDVLRLEALSQSLAFVAHSAEEVTELLRQTGPQDRSRVRSEMETLRRAVRQLAVGVGIGGCYSLR
jgi:hypothetical protein